MQSLMNATRIFSGGRQKICLKLPFKTLFIDNPRVCRIEEYCKNTFNLVLKFGIFRYFSKFDFLQKSKRWGGWQKPGLHFHC
jgi:hypothetical protein